MTTYLATIRHHSISRARQIEIAGSLSDAKRAAAKEFGEEQRDYEIAILATDHPSGPYVVSSRRVGGHKWNDRAA